MLVLGIILNVTGIAGNSTGGILIMAMLSVLRIIDFVILSKPWHCALWARK